MAKEQLNIEQLNIYQKMAKITEEVGTVQKNLTIPTTKTTSYKAVGEKDVLDAIKPLEKKYGIYSYAYDRKVIESGEIVSSKKDYKTEERYEAKQIFLRIEVVYRFVNIDNPQEFIDIKSYGDGIDSGDKATGKAMTYADKYALLKAYKISTGDDPDQEPSGELKSMSNTLPKALAETRAENSSGFMSDSDYKPKASEGQIKYIKALYNKERLERMLKAYKVDKIEDLSVSQANEAIQRGKE